MEIIVLGSGVVGLTSAWYLAQAGHEVTVIDRQSRSGEETSFANAGQISYGYSSPWAAPGIPKKAVKWLLQQHAPLKIKPSLSPQLYKWASQMLLNCSQRRYQVNKSRMLSLSNYSQECLSQLRKEQRISYEGKQQGTLQLFRNQQQLDGAQKDMRLLELSGTQHTLLDVEGCLNQEPGLRPVADKLAGGLYLPDDETGDCFLFCQQLTKLAERAGVKFEFDTNVQSIVKDGDNICGVITNRGTFIADSYVVAMGSYSTQLLNSIGIHIPVYPVKGYSLTVPIKDEQLAPHSTVMDETYKVAMTRFDDRIRIAGTAELTGFDYSIPEKRKATIAMVVKDLFPQAGYFEQGEFWTGLRPMTPDGTPIIGKTQYKNLYTNTGHGTLGWTMACGSAQLLTDVINNNESAIDSQQFDLFRYSA